MIKSLQIKGFQSHTDTEFELHPNLNIIIGSSDSGKSSIIRSLKWLFQNRPNGDSFKNYNLKDKEHVSVTANFDKGFVTRTKSKKDNFYLIDNDEPLQALRTAVPNEVQEVTRMKAINIQSQHPSDQYFLLTESPGQVAKQFNKIAGFEIMDKSLAKVNSIIRETDSELKFINAEIETGAKKVKDMSWITKALSQAEILESLETEIKEGTKTIDKINSICFELQQVKQKLKYFKGIDEAEEKLLHLMEVYKDISQLKIESNNLHSLCESLIHVDTELNDTKGIVQALWGLNTLIELSDEIKLDESTITDLKFALSSIQKAKEEIKDQEIEVQKYQTEFNNFLENETCPTCGRIGGTT